MLIAAAYAQEATDAAGQGQDLFGGGLISFLPLILIFVVFYFLLIRPQQKKAKTHRQMVSNVRRGDRVVTQGGILGAVTKVNSDGEVTVEIAEGVRVRVMKHTLSDVLTKGEARDGASAGR